MQASVIHGIKTIHELPYKQACRLFCTALVRIYTSITCTAWGYYRTANLLLLPLRQIASSCIDAAWQAAPRHGFAACAHLRSAGDAAILLSVYLVMTAIHLAATMALLMLLLATLAVQICLWLVPTVLILVLGKELENLVWTTLQRCGHITAAITRQQQQQAAIAVTLQGRATRQRLNTTVHHKRQQMKRTVLLPVRQKLLSLKLLGKQSQCLICLQDMSCFKIMQIEDCRHGFCKNCVAMHLHTKLRDNQRDILRCPYPDCTGEIAMQQCQEALQQDLQVSFEFASIV